ncbi:proline-rich protein 36, partial [Ooceraea biroi]|uniref:proline-rich protein 36 n=1 Tax=Ooceraea biroi TaxID=2015173 RepID=UPI000F095EA8
IFFFSLSQIIYILALMLLLIKAEQEDATQKPEIAKLEVVDLGETEVDPDSEQLDVQRKRDSGYAYNRLNRVSPSARIRFRANQLRSQAASRPPARLSRPFAKYGPPTHGHYAQQHRNKLEQHDVGQQQPLNIDNGLTQLEVPSPIRDVDFTVVNPIASQNDEPFGMHTSNYLPPQNQKLPAYSSVDNFTPQLQSPQLQSQNSHSQNLVRSQISDAALFLSENAQAIQQLYGAPANNQDFAPGNEHFQTDIGNQVPSDQFRSFESTLQSPQEFRGALPSYASGTLNPHETLEQIQSLEKDRLIVQLQQALAQAQSSEPSADAAGRYAQNQASFVPNRELLASVSQRMKSHLSTTPQSFGLATESEAFSQSPFPPGTTISPLGQFPFNYDVATTARAPTTTTTAATTVAGLPPPQSPKDDGTSQVASSQPVPNQPGLPAAPSSPVGVPVYGGFAPTVIAGTNFIPSYSTGLLTPVRPVRPAFGTSPTQFGIPIPTEAPGEPASDSPSVPTTTTPSSFKPPLANQPGFGLTPTITPVALPVQPIRPVAAPLHPLATHPVISNPPHPVLPVTSTAQVHPVQTATPAVTSSVQHTYGVQTALINPIVYKPLKAVYPVYYYPNVAYQLQKPALLPSYPWNYAPSYAQTKPAQTWK